VRGYKFPEGPVSWREYVDLLGRAKIGVSFSMDMAGEPQAKLRPFEVAACGALLLAEKPNYLGSHLCEGKEYIAFTDEQGMIEECEYFLLHDQEREAIAMRGYGRTVREHTFENRLREVFKWALSTRA
jgi:spore maturation protein CgeB